MLTIRPEQMEKFSEAALKSFEDRMVPFLATHFRDQSRALGESRVRLLVRHGIGRAGSYGIDGQRDVCQYICLMFVFGGNFDVNPKLSSMRAVLDDARLADSGTKIRTLYSAANRELHERAS